MSTKVSGLIQVVFDVDNFDEGDPTVIVVRDAILAVAQSARHRSAGAGVQVGDINASLHAADGTVLDLFAVAKLAAAAPPADESGQT